MTSDKIPVAILVRNPDLRGVLVKNVANVPGFLVNGAGADSGLLIKEVGVDPEAEIRELERLAEAAPRREIFLASERIKPDLLLKAMRLGVREFLLLPLREDELTQALLRLRERWERKLAEGAPLGVAVDVIAAKGGAGATTLAVNLAAAFRALPGGKRVALLDLNAPYGEAQIFLDLLPKYAWDEALRDPSRLDASMLSGIMAEHPSGLRLLAAPGRLDDVQPPTPLFLSTVLGLLRRMFEVVVVDGGDFLDDAALKVMEISDEILFVAQPSLPYLTSASRYLQMLRRSALFQEQKIKIVLNRMAKDGEISPEHIQESLGRSPFHSLPEGGVAARRAMNQGRTLLDADSGSALARSVVKLAERLAAERGLLAKRSGFLGMRLFSRKDDARRTAV